MGRTALFLVMGLGMALGFISYNISGTTQRALETNYTYYKYMYARNLARSAIHAALRDYDNSADSTVTQLTEIPFAGGRYRIVSLTTSASPADTLWITTRGTFADTIYTISATLHRTTRPFPRVNSALGILATVQNFTMNGKPEVDGRNYDATGTSLVGSGNLPGVTTLTSADSQKVMDGRGGGTISGVVPVALDNDPQDPESFIEEYENNHDIKLTAGNYNSQTYGSSTNPVVVYADGTGGTVQFAGNTTGYGILAVRGSQLRLGGTFKWHGLVVILSDSSTVEFDEFGTPGIIGGLIVAQANHGPAKITISGTGANAKLRYSSAAIRNATNVGRLRYYRVIDWYE